MRIWALLLLFPVIPLSWAQTIDLGNNIVLTGEVVPFESTKHTIMRCNHPDWALPPVCLIDGRPFFGHDLDVTFPRTELAWLSVSIAEKDIALDVVGMFNPNGNAQLRPDQFRIKPSDGIDALDIIGQFSDGAGTYVAVWKVMAGGSIRTVISGSENEVAHWWHEEPYPERSKQ